MALTNAQHQAKYREQRKQARDALAQIIAALEGNEKPLAEKLRCIAWAGLNG